MTYRTWQLACVLIELLPFKIYVNMSDFDTTHFVFEIFLHKWR